MLLAGCAQAPSSSPTQTAVPIASRTPVTAVSDVTATPPPSPHPLEPPPTATRSPATETPGPTDTPVPRVVRIALAPHLFPAYRSLLAADAAFAWVLVPAAEPVTALADGAADVAIRRGEGDLRLPATPLVIAVPFTTDWEATTVATAEAIIAGGHSLARVVDWAALTPREKPLLVDGHHPTVADYPLRQSWSLIAAPGFEDAARHLSNVAAVTPPAEPVVHLAAVGDIMLDRVFHAILAAGRIEYPFAHVADQLRTADLTVGNVESSLGDGGEPAPKRYTFQAPPQAAEALRAAGFDVVSLANNHALDFGPDALLHGISLLNAAGVAPVGAGADADAARAPYVTTVNGLTFAFLAYAHVPVERGGFDTAVWTATATTPGLAWGDPARIAGDVGRIAPLVDHTIVLLHSGLEYIAEPSEPQVAAARAAIDAGATAVIGHHSHILQGVEFYGDGVIAYGLGNFAFPIDGDPTTAILHLWFDVDGVRQLSFAPAIIGEDARPRPATAAESETIRRHVYFLTTLLNPQRRDGTAP